ncbi:hypothetical protein PG984_006912 [Apiospora sp. TS-2023a]
MPTVRLSGVDITSSVFLTASETWDSKRGRTRSPELPMRVLCLGLSRTGTVSLRAALAQLAYRPYHGLSMMENPPDAHLWRHILDNKFRGTAFPPFPSFGTITTAKFPLSSTDDEADERVAWFRKYFDQVLSDSDACLDIPASLLAEELLSAYPGAKVIITVRDADEWYSSWMATIKQKRAWAGRVWSFLLLKLDRASRLYIPIMEDCVKAKYGAVFEDSDPETAKNVYRSHLARVQELAPECLLFDLKDGWGPLCQFLGAQVPRIDDGAPAPFPRLNDREEWNQMFGTLMRKAVIRRILEITTVGAVLSFAVIMLSILYCRRSSNLEGSPVSS